MKITSISFSGSNPSMGPHNSESSRSLNMTSYEAEANALLDDTMINGEVTLRQYLQFHVQNKKEEIHRVKNAYEPEHLTTGARIIDLNISIEDHGTVSLEDLRRFRIEGKGYTDFEKLIREKGSVHTSPSMHEMKREIESANLRPKEDPEVSKISKELRSLKDED
ncbi:MAG: hypothetical protein HRT45_00305 [Bdellovibrionales bacterium]|nr:hypothetical protein [Bdellovibrionales bacterium]